MPAERNEPKRLPTLTLYTREGCHLCDLALEQLRRLDFRVTLLDIDHDLGLKERFGHDVPVLALGERVLLKGVLSKSRLSLLKVQLLREFPAS